MSTPFIKQLATRRTIYGLSKKDFPLTNDQVVKLVEEVVAYTPSAFNNQTSRAIVLFGASHDKLWEITRSALKSILPAKDFEASSQRIDGFAAGYGTVLFFEDTAVIKSFEEKFPIYAANFAPWSAHNSGAAQLNLWTAFSNAGNIGANLQHYNALIEETVSKEFNVPANWKLVSQLVFGTKAGEVNPDKTTLPASETVKSFN